MKRLGRHVLAEFCGCDRNLLNDRPAMERILGEAARRADATIVDMVFHQYNPHGLSGVVVIAESHISIHTWPEYGYAAADFFTCGEQVDPWKACHYMREQLKCTEMETRELPRGMPGREEEMLPHKPAEKLATEPDVA